MIARCEGGINWAWYVEYYQYTPTDVILSRHFRVHLGDDNHPEVTTPYEARVVTDEARIVRKLELTDIVRCQRVVVEQYGINNPRHINLY